MRAPALVLIVAACGSSSSSPSTKLQTLITSDWTLQPGTETYQCARVTLDHDIYVTEFSAIAPQGTHHSIVSMDTAPTIADNPGYPCTNPTEFAPTIVYGNGLGSPPFDFPQGVGVELAAGTQVQVNLHLFNSTDQVLTGTSGVQVNSVSADEVTNLARIEINGPSSFTLPTGVSTQNFSCRVKNDVSLIAFAPHMHKLGTHETFKVSPLGANAVTLYDGDYSFDAQDHAMITPIYQLHMGDSLGITCSYNNTTGQPVSFGYSSNNEMCIGGYWFYPSANSLCY